MILNNKINSKLGLTLVELLIVITIIGLLASIFAINVSKYRARTRDSQRVADIRTLQQGLAFYYYRSDYSGSYPIDDVDITGSDSVSLELKSVGAMSVVPIDPLTGTYDYHYFSSDGASYILRFYLETNAIAGKIQGWNQITP